MVKWSQHFLIDKNIAKKIVKAANISKKDTVVEIGPGRGILSEYIVPLAKSFIGVEIDTELCLFLKQKLPQKNVSIINADFLTLDLSGLLPERAQFGSIKIVANLPYEITTPILKKILPFQNWSEAVFMVQKEVGMRMLAKPGTHDFGRLSLLVQFYANGKKLFNVTPQCFFPEPAVYSVVVLLQRKHNTYPHRETFFELVQMLFQQRRKTILNSLSTSLSVDKSTVWNILCEMGIRPSLRPEQLTIEQYYVLSEKFLHKLTCKNSVNFVK